MAVTQLYSGSTSISTTETSLTTATSGPDADTTTGVFQVFIDVSDMVAGDQLQIRVYEKVRSGDTQRIVYQAILTGTQSEPVWVSPSLALMHGWDVTLDALAGTVTCNWSIRQVA